MRWPHRPETQDDGRFAADFESGDGRGAGMGEYSPTAIGALANLCATLIKVAEDAADLDKG